MKVSHVAIWRSAANLLEAAFEGTEAKASPK